MKIFQGFIAKVVFISGLSCFFLNTISDVQAKKRAAVKVVNAKKAEPSPQKLPESNEPDIFVSDYNLSNFPVTQAKQAILQDFHSGLILFSKNAHKSMHPSSMTKIATACFVEHHIQQGTCSLDSIFVVPKEAYRKEGSTSSLKLGQKVSVRDLLKGLIIQSGNDAAVTLAFGLCGNEENFAHALNEYLLNIGLKETHFMNASGLPDPHHYTTAYDLLLLARHAIIDYPKFYDLYSQQSFSFNNVTQNNRNTLLQAGIGCDGLKTGKTEAGGCGIVASTNQEGRRLILVVNGYSSESQRKTDAFALLSWGQKTFTNNVLYKADTIVAQIPVWYGQTSFLPVQISKDVIVTLPRNAKQDFKVFITYNTPVAAPIHKGEKMGELCIQSPFLKKPLIFPLHAALSVTEAGFLKKIQDSISYLIWGVRKPAAVNIAK